MSAGSNKLGGVDKTWLSSFAMALAAVLAIIFLVTSCTQNGVNNDTKRMQSCVESGKTWVLAENRSNVMECK